MEEHAESPPPLGESDGIPPIMWIPREIRGAIFNRLPQNEKASLRFVCQAWKQEVDDFCEFSVTLDDRRPLEWLQRISQLKIKQCKVVHLLQPLPTVEWEGVPDCFFRYPSYLRSLQIISENVTPANFHILLKDTCAHLHEFCGVLLLPLLQFAEYPPEFPGKFKKLRKLRLSVSTMPCGDEPFTGPPRFRDALLHKIFRTDQVMKNLKSLAIEMRCLGVAQSSQLSALILAFIATHNQTLDELDFDLIQGNHGIPPSYNEPRPLNESDLEKIDLKLLKKCNHFDVLRVVNSTAVGVDLWQQILARQTKLRFVETDILPAPLQLYQQLVLNNEATLVHVDIGDLTLNWDSDDEENRRFDCSVFQNCARLRKLTLDKNTLRRRPPGEETAELINLQLLPVFLEELNINYFLVLSLELLLLFGQERSGEEGLEGSATAKDNLRTLALTQCGDHGDFGVNGSVLEKIIAMRALQFVEISPLNFSEPEERQKLNRILTTFGYTPDHAYFQVSRVSQNFQINFDDFSP